MAEDTLPNNEPIIQPLCINGDVDCYNLFTKLIRTVNNQDGKITQIRDALLGGEFNPEKGLIKQVQKLEGRIKILEKVYIGAAAVVTVGGVILMILKKIGVSFTV